MADTDSLAEIHRRLAALQREHDELVASLPRHTPRAMHLIRIEELEEEIASLQRLITRPDQPPDPSSTSMI
jgi:hypothetical protein